MLETLSKMSGKTHRSRRDSKTITTNLQKIALRNEGKLSYTIATKEEPVIAYNDMAFIGKRNSIVFRAGDSPIWNRNETVLPMSWRLLKNSITQPGHDYSLKDVPTLSSAKDFDVRKNQPDFAKMLEKRIKQSLKVEDAEEAFKKAFGYDEHEIATLDPNNYSYNIMLLINNAIKLEEKPKQIPNGMKYQDPSKGDDTKTLIISAVENEEQKQANADESLKYEQVTEKLYAGGFLSKNDLVDHGRVNAHGLDKAIIDIYNQYRSDFERDKEHFTVADDGTLENATGDQNFILAQKKSNLARETEAINDAAKNPKTRTYAEDDTEVPRTYDVQDAFYRYLASLPSWKDLANGTFEREMAYSCRHGDDDLIHADDDE